MVDRYNLLKLGSLVLFSTAAVTVAFIGVLAMLAGTNPDIESRFPYYAVALTVSFTAMVIILERHLATGYHILITSTVLAISLALVVVLDVEGIIYASDRSNELVASQLILYLAAAGCLCTGLIYWGVHHWREFVAGP